MNQDPQAREFAPIHEHCVGEVRDILKAKGGEGFEDRSLGNISTDSRTLAAGEVYLALRGENFDGHRFVEAAVQAGAGGLIVSTDYEMPGAADIPVLRVEDPLEAFGRLAAWQRKTWAGQVIALSGSAGKTTTRRLTAHGLSRHRHVLEPIRNFNNLVGVPKTLLRLRAEHEVVVAELGINQPGELERLTEMAAPDVAGLTNLGEAHVGMFGSMEALADAKGAIFRRSPSTAVLVANADCARSQEIVRRHAEGRKVVTFSSSAERQGDVRIENVRDEGGGGYRFDLSWPEGQVSDVRMKAFGRHFLENVAAAAALLYAGGHDPSWAIEDLENFKTEPLRGQILEARGYTLILDCYNASPGGMVSALESLPAAPRQQRLILVLADMLELGEFSASAHDALKPLLLGLGPDCLLTLGAECGRLARELANEGLDAQAFDDRETLSTRIQAMLRPGDVIFLKGSRRFELEEIAKDVAGEIPGWKGAH